MTWITPPARKEKPLPPAMAAPKRKGIAFIVVLVPTVIGAVVGVLVALVIQPTWARALVILGGTGLGSYIGLHSLVSVLVTGAKYEKEH